MPALSLAMAAVVALSGGAAAARDAGDGAAAPSAPEGGVEIAVETTLTPRIDPVFPVFVDARGAARVIERFGAHDSEMQRIRDAFSTAQQTLAVLPRDSKGGRGVCSDRA